MPGGEVIDRFRLHRLPEGEILFREIGEEFPERPRVDHRAGEGVFAQVAGLLEHSDLEVGPAPRLRQPCQLDGACQPCRPRAHKQHVHLQGLRARPMAQDQAVEGKLPLMSGG